MPKLMILFLIMLLQSLTAQTIDSSAIRQVDSLIQSSRNLTEQKEYEKATVVNQAAMRLAESAFGKESPAYASVAFNTGRIYYFREKPLEAEDWYRKALEIRARVSGRMNLDYMKTASNLADVCRVAAKYREAEILYLEADSITTILLGKDHPIKLHILGNLGYLYQLVGYYERALWCQQESARLSERLYGMKSVEHAKSLNSLGNVYNFLGDDANAEIMYRQSLALYEQFEGRHSLGYTGLLINLSLMYMEWGLSEKSLPLLEEARDILENKIHEIRHQFYRNCLNNLSMNYGILKQYDKATELCLRRLGLVQEMVGSMHPDYAMGLCDLADLYRVTDKLSEADSLYRKCLSILEKVEGNVTTKKIRPLMGLCDLLRDKGEYVQAESYAQEADRMLKMISVKWKLTYTTNLFVLAEIFERQGKFGESDASFRDACGQVRERLIKSATFQSEKVLEASRRTFANHVSNLNSIMLSRHLQHLELGELPSISYDQCLFEKGFLQSAATQLGQSARQTPETAKLYEQLKGIRRQLYQAYSNPGSGDLQIQDLEEKADLLEKELARKVSGFDRAIRQVNWKDVQASLKPGEVACEFLSFRLLYPYETNARQYAALLILPQSARPVFVPLCSQGALDSLLRTQGARKADYVNALYTLADRGAAEVVAGTVSLYELVWKPLEPQLAGVQTIYVSSEGLLHRINLDALPMGAGSTVADRYNLIHVGSTRQLVLPDSGAPGSQDALLYGGLLYDADSVGIQSNENLASRSPEQTATRYVDPGTRGAGWTYLAGTDKEVRSIETLVRAAGMQAQVRSGDQGTEESFKALGSGKSSPRVLHIATHGYFFPDLREERRKVTGNEEPAFKTSEHPMLRSGLILSGGNAGWNRVQGLEDREDGILTAYEISQMNLSNTELVVLSACETGLGDIQGNEGVYGLQRAFKIAGVKYIIMSLWQVPDKQTSMLMTTFYRKWLEDKLSIPEAFHAAQKELRELGFDPYYWAGFVLVE